MATIISTKTSGVGGLQVTGDASGILQLASNNGTTAVTVDASQNVGIGTASPSYKLHSAGTVGSGSTGTNGSYAFKRSSDGAELATVAVDGTSLIYNSGLGTHIWQGGGTERMRIDSSGNVLINTTSVIGGVSKQSVAYNGAANWGIGINDTSSTNGSSFIQFQTGGTNRGSITNNGNTGVAYNTTSDYRLKENVQPMVGALDTIAQLKPITYDWIADKSKGQGFIAHELQAVVPDCVTGEKDAVDADGNPVYQGIDTSFLVATLTAAIQELSAKVTALEAQLGAK